MNIGRNQFYYILTTDDPNTFLMDGIALPRNLSWLQGIRIAH